MKNPIIPGIIIVQLLMLGIILSMGAQADQESQQQQAQIKPASCDRNGHNGPSNEVKRHHLTPQQLTASLANELGVPDAQFDEVFRNLEHPRPSMRHDEAQAIKLNNHKVIAKAFNLDEETVVKAMHKFRPRGPMPPHHDRMNQEQSPEGQSMQHGDDRDHGRPVEAVAKELGVTPEQFREAFKKVTPAARGTEPTEAQRKHNRQVLSEALGVDPQKLDAVMDKYRPEGPNQRPPRPEY
ncbi:MAG: hypothetical protein ACF8OB_11360 [Phycisphaeraceae bacterium JB051]